MRDANRDQKCGVWGSGTARSGNTVGSGDSIVCLLPGVAYSSSLSDPVRRDSPNGYEKGTIQRASWGRRRVMAGASEERAQQRTIHRSVPGPDFLR